MPSKEWWRDEEATDRHVARLIIERLGEGEGEGWDEFEEFDDAYASVPVSLDRKTGKWMVLSRKSSWETGVTVGDVSDARVTTVGELANKLNLSPSTLAADYGWPSTSWPLEYYSERSPAVARAVAARALRRDGELRDAAEERRFIREDQDAYDRDEARWQAEQRGETLIYAPSGMTREQAGDFLGMPEDSQTVGLFVSKMIDMKEALRRARKITHRHESTDYEYLLAMGVDRDTARLMVEE